MAFQTKLLNGLQEFINQITEYVKLCVVPVGTVTMYMGKGTTPPKGWLFCDGSTVSAETYPELYAFIGSKTPNMNGMFPMGTNTTSDVGVSVDAGLPNITGKFSFDDKNGSSRYIAEGAFTTENPGGFSNSASARVGEDGNADYTFPVYFNAWKSNPIYGGSSTVQPPAIKMRYIIKAK